MDEQHVKSVFFRLAGLAPSLRRAEFDAICGDDAEFRGRLERLLAWSDQARTMSDEPTVSTVETDSGPPAEWPLPPAPLSLRPEQVLGRYTLVRLIDKGGMGEVWAAEQDQPKRPVALKLVRSDRVSDSYVRRIAYEAEILGRLRHPGIAQVYDAGLVTIGNREHPFIVMELVDGRPLDDYLRTHALGTAAKLDMFTRITAAIHYAHQRGIVHRDLKPSNVLVEPGGDTKIVDFGVSTTEDTELAELFGVDERGGLIGTVPYMAPEQAAGEPVSTATDIYALGLLLYEMIAERLPYSVRGVSVSTALRVIREVEPEPLGTHAPGIPADLPWVTGKALRKAPEQRYQSAFDLGVDVRRVLTSHPVEARPPTSSYLLARFAQRNRTLVAGLAASAILLVGGVSGILWFALEADKGRAIAEESLGRMTEPMIAAADPERQRNRRVVDITAVDLLRHVAGELDEQPFEFPSSEARIRGEFGRLLMAFSDFESAEPQLRSAVERARRDPPPPRRYAQLQLSLAELLYRTGRPEEAQEFAGEGLRLLERSGAARIDLASGIMHLANAMKNSRRYTEAIETYSRALDTLETTRTEEAKELQLRLRYNRALAMRAQGDLESAATEMAAVLADRERLLPASHIDIGYAKGELAALFTLLDRFDEAEPLYDSAIKVLEHHLPLPHWRLIEYNGNRATLFRRQGRYPEALELYESILHDAVQVHGAEDPVTLQLELLHAYCLARAGELVEGCAKLFEFRARADSLGHTRLVAACDRFIDELSCEEAGITTR